MDDLNNIDLNNPVAATQAAYKLKTLMEDSGIKVTMNPMQLEMSLRKLDKSFREFVLVLND